MSKSCSLFSIASVILILSILTSSGLVGCGPSPADLEGDRYFNYASGHGGQLIVLLDELDMVIVTATDLFWQQHDDELWKHESAAIELVGKFINSLPGG